MATFNASQNGNWSDPATWGGAGVPGLGDTATIDNVEVVIDDDLNIGYEDVEVSAVTIQHGGIVKTKTDINITINCYGRWLISNNSDFYIGSKTDPVKSGVKHIFNLIANDATHKPCFVANGSGAVFHAHSEGYDVFYDELSADAPAGQNKIVIVGDMEIYAGDELYLKATETQTAFEVLTVDNYDAPTKTVTFTTNLTYSHNSGCFVCNLNKNIILNRKAGIYGRPVMINNLAKMDIDGLRFEGLYDSVANGFGYASYLWSAYNQWSGETPTLQNNIVFYDFFASISGTIGGQYIGEAGYSNTVFYKTHLYAFGADPGTEESFYKFENVFYLALNQVSLSLEVFYGAVVNNLRFYDFTNMTTGYELKIVNDGVINGCVIDSFTGRFVFLSNANQAGLVNNLTINKTFPQTFCFYDHNDWVKSYTTFKNCEFYNLGVYPLFYRSGSAARQQNVYNLINCNLNEIPIQDYAESAVSSYELDSTTKRSGNYSLKITISSAYHRVAILRARIPCTTGKAITINGFVKVSDSMDYLPLIRLSGLGVADEHLFTQTTDWQNFTLSVEPDYEGAVYVEFVYNSKIPGKSIWIDDFTVNSARINMGDFEFLGDQIFPPVILKTELDAADILRQSIASYTESGTVGEAFNELALLRKLSKNKREIDTVNNQIVFYDDDGTTELLRINIFNAAGDPAYKNITKWVPV